jgi:carboxyl-terminal processing protease
MRMVMILTAAVAIGVAISAPGLHAQEVETTPASVAAGERGYHTFPGLDRGPAVPAAPQETTIRERIRALVQREVEEAEEAWGRHDYTVAVARLEDLSALPSLEDFGISPGTLLYHLACGHALLGETRESVAALRAAVAAGFGDPERLMEDPDLASVRSDPGFQSLVAKLRATLHRWEGQAFATPYAEDLRPEEKVAGLALLWAQARYGFAHFDAIPDLDWDRLFIEAIPEVQQTRSTAEYYRILMRLTARLDDGHTNVFLPDELFRRLYSRPAIDTRLIDGGVYIVAVLADSLRGRGVQPGLEIVSVEGVPVHEYARTRVAPYHSSSTHQGSEFATYSYYLLCGTPDQDVRLELRDADGVLTQVALPRSVHRLLTAKPFEHRILDGGIGYVAINTFGSRSPVAAFDSLFSALEKTEALIIDLRRNAGGNSQFADEILAYLTREPFRTTSGRVPLYNPYAHAVGRCPQRWEELPRQTHPTAARFYGKPVAVLIGPQTGSAAEDFCATFAAMQRGPLIGMPTAGSTGQPVSFPLPGGGTGRVCSVVATGPDGREFVGSGIQPDIAVHTTVADLRAGRDAELAAAVRELRRMMSGD